MNDELTSEAATLQEPFLTTVRHTKMPGLGRHKMRTHKKCTQTLTKSGLHPREFCNEVFTHHSKTVTAETSRWGH